MADNSIIRRPGYILLQPGGTLDAGMIDAVWDSASQDELVTLTQVVLELHKLVVSFDSVYRNFTSLSSIQDDLTSELSNSDKRPTPFYDALDGISIAVCAIQNFLTSAGSFLTISAVEIKRWNKYRNDTFSIWNERRKDFHAASFSYKLMYGLRNYSQHYGVPISKLDMAGQRNTVGGPLILGAKLMIERAHLLGIGYDWGNLETEIASQPTEFDLMPHAISYFNDLRKLLLLAMEIRALELRQCIQYFKVVARTLRVPKHAIPVIFLGESEIPNTPPSNYHAIPFEDLRWLMGRFETYQEFDTGLPLK